MTLPQRTPAEACSCGALDPHLPLLSLDQALAAVSTLTDPIAQREDLPLTSANGRILAAGLQAMAATPPFDNSAMDGYAVRCSDFSGSGPWVLPVSHRIPAGAAGRSALAPGDTARILTGAALPDGADAVVMQESVTVAPGGVRFDAAPEPGQNVRLTGEDIRPGTVVLPAGTRLTARSVALAAAAGADRLTVRRKIRIALLSTGNELCAPGQDRGATGIWDVNGPMLSAAMTSPEIQYLGQFHAADSLSDLSAVLADLSQKADLIVTTGGVSAGDADLVKPALLGIGGSIAFAGVAIKPGKPLSAGRIGQALWLGLPGNPVAAYVCWQVFGKRLLDALTGAVPTGAFQKAALGHAISRQPGRCELRPARLQGMNAADCPVAVAPNATNSARVTDLAVSDGLIVLPADQSQFEAGSRVDFFSFNNNAG